jgi:opacity protein-like surface antigen
MRFTWGLALLLIGAIGIADAQERFVPVLGVAAREYGVSGMYTLTPMTDSTDYSNFAITGRYAYSLGFGLQLEAETGYNRFHNDIQDSTGQSWSIAGNAIMNIPLLSERLSAFGLVGYGYTRTWTSAVYPAPIDKVTSKWSHRYLQYGFGAKYMLVANAGLRVDYRWINPSGVPAGVSDHTWQQLLIGISVFQ